MRLSSPHPALVFAVIFVAIFLLHAPLLQLPYFWDEAGYYVPAARDILLSGSLIPHSTISNAHPPLVLAWVALWWKVVGYAPLVTRSAMLVVSAFSLLGLFRLAQRAANTQVAIASTLCTALYPVFFAQSSLAQVDLAAAGLTFWALRAYLEDRPIATAIWFSLSALAKETAIIAPLALAGWELLCFAVPQYAGAQRAEVQRERAEQGRAKREGAEREETKREGTERVAAQRGRAALQGRVSPPGSVGASAPAVAFGLQSLWLNRRTQSATRKILPLLFPILPLALWYAYHYARTGYVLGNPEFFRYNVAATLNPLRFLLALALRLWQAFGYLHLWLLTLGMLFAMSLPPVKDANPKKGNTNVGTAAPGCPVERSSTAIERLRIAVPVQIIFLVVVATYVIAMALIGGAVLARYMLPAVPLLIIVAVSTLRRRLRYWPAAIAVIAVAFVAAWLWNPPYGFSPEDNLAYRDYVVLHQDAERFLEARYPMARSLTAWPASDELTRPWLGYTTRPVQVVRIEDFSLDEVLSAADFRQKFEVALVFSTKYEPTHPLLDRWKAWTDLKRRFFGYHRDVPPAAVAQILGGHIVFSEARKGQWVAVIEMERSEIVNATSADDRTTSALLEAFRRLDGQHWTSAPRACSDYRCIKWHECVLITSHTSRPGSSCSESRAASVRWTSISTLHFTRAHTTTSRCSIDAIRPGIMLRALNPTGGTVATKISPARIPTRIDDPTPPRTRGVSSSTGSPCPVVGTAHIIVPRSGCTASTVASKIFSNPTSCATVSWRGALMTSCGVPWATMRPSSSTSTRSPSAKTSSRLCVT